MGKEVPEVVTLKQFDVCPNPDPDTAEEHPYLVILQSDRLPALGTCIMAPLVSPRTIQFYERLLPKVLMRDREYVLAVPDMVAVPIGEIERPIANLEEFRYSISNALDMVFHGI